MEKQRNCYVFVYNGYSDWEPALAMYGLHNFSDFAVTTFSIDGAPVRSGGNLSVTPDTFLEALRPESIDLLILPGGMALQQNDPALHAILPLLRYMIQQRKPLAAICGATTLLARNGLLDHADHTSNALQYLQLTAPEYQAAPRYVEAPSVDDQELITASGTQPAAFAASIFNHFNLLTNPDFKFWFGFFQAGAAPGLETAPAFHFFHRRFTVTLAEMLELVREAPKEIYKDAIAQGLEICGPQQWHYHGFDGHPATRGELRIGLPVATLRPVQGPYHLEATAPLSCVSALHKGPWHKLEQTYNQLITGARMSHLPLTGESREHYIHCDFEHPENNLTLVQVGVHAGD